MIIFVDENLPPHLARGFDILQKPENIKLTGAIFVKSIVENNIKYLNGVTINFDGGHSNYVL